MYEIVIRTQYKIDFERVVHGLCQHSLCHKHSQDNYVFFSYPFEVYIDAFDRRVLSCYPEMEPRPFWGLIDRLAILALSGYVLIECQDDDGNSVAFKVHNRHTYRGEARWVEVA